MLSNTKIHRTFLCWLDMIAIKPENYKGKQYVVPSGHKNIRDAIKLQPGTKKISMSAEILIQDISIGQQLINSYLTIKLHFTDLTPGYSCLLP